MKIQSELFGEIEVSEEEAVHFSEGLLAFEDYKKFVLLDLPENPLIKWLQSLDESTLGFLVTSPFHFFPDYEFDLSDRDKKDIGLEKIEDVGVLTILTIPGNDFSKTTANLVGPIILNVRNKKAKQVVLQDVKYSTKAPLFKEELSETNVETGTLKEACK